MDKHVMIFGGSPISPWTIPENSTSPRISDTNNSIKFHKNSHEKYLDMGIENGISWEFSWNFELIYDGKCGGKSVDSRLGSYGENNQLVIGIYATT